MGKPCRVCDGFKDWAQSQAPAAGSSSSSKEQANATPPKPELVPPMTAPLPVANNADDGADQHDYTKPAPDKLELGRSTWTFLHTMASYYPDEPAPEDQQAATSIMHSLSRLYPCSWCAKHLRDNLKVNAPRVESRSALELWMCELHNEVNERLGKAQFDCTKVRQRWRENE